MLLIKRLQDNLTDSKVALSDVLRSMKLLAAELGSDELQKWATQELVGYPDEASVPSYRILRTSTFGVFAGVGGSRESRMLPSFGLPDAIKDAALELRLAQPIAEIEALARAPDDDARREWPQEWIILSRSAFQLSNGMQLISAYSPIGQAELAGVLDTVRTRALDFVIGLRVRNPEVVNSDSALSEMQSEVVRQVFNLTVTGGTAIVAAGHSVTQSTTATVTTGDINSLIEALLERGIGRDDAQELEGALIADGRPSKRELGPKVSTWYAKMISKAASGAWQIAVDSAASVLSSAIGKYYGW
jgi:hypothetical protein